MNTRLARAAAAAALLLTTLPLFAGSLERFLLPRTKTARAYDVAATPTHAWAIEYNDGVVAKVGLDGVVQDVINVSPWIQQIAVDPLDHSLWYASDFSVGHLSLTGEITDYDLILGHPGDVQDFIFGPDGHLWVSFYWGMLARVSRAGQVTAFPGFGGSFTRLAAGPDGNVWVSDYYDKTISRVTPAGTRTVFTLDVPSHEYLQGITAGPDGNLWFVSTQNILRRMNTSGAITGTFAAGGASRDIVAGADGNLWVTNGYEVARFDLSSNTIAWRYTPPAGTGFLWSLSVSSTNVWWGSDGHRIGSISYGLDTMSAPFLLRGPDPHSSASSSAHIWFTAPDDNQIGRLDPADGSAVMFTLPNADSRPLDIVAGPDAMWFTEETGDRIGRIDGNGVIQEFPVPTPAKKPTAIAYGPDGNFWFTLMDGNAVARLTPAGSFTEFALPQPGCGPNSLASGPDGNLWITCKTSKHVLRMNLGGAVTGTFAVNGNDPGAIVSAPDGNLWFSTWLNHFRLTPAGVMTKYEWPSAGHGMERVIGPDGVIWDTNYNSIVRTTLDGMSHHYNFTQHVNGRALTKGPDARIWFSDSNTDAWLRFTPENNIIATGRTLCYGPGNPAIAFQTIFTFLDSDAARPPDAYHVWIEWEDGQRDYNVQLVPTNHPGEYAIKGAHYYGDTGPRTAKAVIRSDRDATHFGETVVAYATIPAFAATADRTSFHREGGSGTIQVTADAACSWTASIWQSWITFPNGSSGQGSGTLDFTVAPNDQSSTSRSMDINISGVSVVIHQSGQPDPSSSLYVMTPCRILDTRNGAGPHPSGSTIRRFAANACGIPADAEALVTNVTVVAPSASGWLSLHPGDSYWPGVSTVNYRVHRTRANNVLLKLDSGFYNVLNSGADVHYAIDVMGYFK